jgi:glyoxylase-like metal-dependent hydrolase (beta-lactamase superfamily II)
MKESIEKSGRQSTAFRLLLSSTLLLAPLSLGPARAQAEPSVKGDYFHTGAGARYLVRAKSPLEVRHLRGNITVLIGSGGNITVLSGKDGKFLIDAGISPSKNNIIAALNDMGNSPIRYVVNTHWHWDHTDGDAWLHAAGAQIIAHRNTLKHLTQTTHVDDWNWTFHPVPSGARPTIIVDKEMAFSFDGETVQLGNSGPGHTDGDLLAYFKQADVLATGDTFWNGHYPFIDNEDGGSIDSAINWANTAIGMTTDHTILVPGHGPVGNRADLIEFRDMLVAVRDKVAALKRQGKSLQEIIAAKPTAQFDAKWGGFVIGGDLFTKLVYDGLR